MDVDGYILQLKNLLVNKGLAETLMELQRTLDKQSKKYDTLILITAEHKRLDQTYLAGIVNEVEELSLLAKLRARCLRFINSIELEDLIYPNKNAIDQNDFGSKDIPADILISLNRMTPEIAAKRLKVFSDRIKSLIPLVKEASEKKEAHARKAYDRLRAMNRTGKQDLRLLKKYSSNFMAAFDDLNQAWGRIGEALDFASKESAVLVLFQIQNAYTTGKLERSKYEQIRDTINLMIEKYDVIHRTLDERIDNQQHSLLDNEKMLTNLGVIGKSKKGLNSNINLRDSIVRFREEISALASGLEILENDSLIWI